MTYNYRYWTAFREADLLKAGDHSIGTGDSFVMPGAATVKLAAYDNDGQLSGDNAYDQATDSDGHYDQYGWVNDGSGWQRTGDLYVEKTFTLRGSDGKTYILAEIEGEGHDAAGEGDDYFSFVGAVPPAGVTLHVVSKADSHGVNYADLSADAPAHVNAAPTFDNAPADGVIHINENETAVIDLNASDADGDTLTYTITGGADAAFFEINAHTGALTFKAAPDYEHPEDVSGYNNVYDVTVTVSDGNGGETTKAMWVKVKDVDEAVNTAPVFDNLPADGIICIDENTSFVIDANASDADGDALTYKIVGGRDAAFFEIDAHTGELSFKNDPDFESPSSGGGSNTYDVTVEVSDGNGGTAVKPMWVKVKDVDESTGGELACIVVEAEDMNAWGFNTVHGSQASGGELVRMNNLGGTGDLSTTFNGDAGTYDLTLFAQDESDGQSTVMVKVNGEVVQTIVLDGDNNGAGSNNSGFSEFTVEGLELNAGDKIGLWARSDAGEYVRIDKIKLQEVEAEEVDPNMVCLDFEGLTAGTVVNQQFDGVMISAQRDGDGSSSSTSPNDAMIFDSNNPTGGDHDLETNNQNNILIVSEDNDSSDPDDNAGGGTIWFKFDTPSYIDSIKVIDAEEGGTIRLIGANGQLIKTVTIPGGTDGGIQTVDIDAEGVVQIDLTLNGSGAIDDLKYIPGEAAPLGSISGVVFMDTNDNNVQDADDMPAAGETVELWQRVDGVWTAVQTQTTDANGAYHFEGLEADPDYFVRFLTNDDGKTFVTANVGGDDTVDSDGVQTVGTGIQVRVPLGEGENVTDVDQGIEDPGTASLAGRVFMDNNDNSVDDNGDMGVAGVTVTLSNGQTTVTDADGNYEFTGLAAGDYTVTFPTEVDGKTLVDSNVGGDDTIDSDAGANGSTGTIGLDIGERSEDNDAGLEVVDTGDAAIKGRVFMDNNDNNVDDNGDMGVAGVTVTLSNGQTTVTDANGNYEFTGLAAGDYTVTFPTEVDGKVLVDSNVGGDDTIDSDAGANGSTGVITVGIGEVSEDNDAGVTDPGTASIGDKVFLDANGNGQQDAGEAGVDGVQVTLFNAAGVAISTITTSNGGMYLFENLDAGDYSVGFEAPDGYDLTDANVGNDASDSDADQGTGRTDTINLEIGEADLTVDAGLVEQNTAPNANDDDAGKACADKDITVDVLANDTDADGDALSVTAVNGQAIAEGQTIDVDGVDVSLVGGSLVFNGEAAYADLNVGEEASVTYTYTVSDGNGGTGTANVEVGYCGVAETIQDICDSLPSSINYQIVDEYENGNDGAFTLKIDGSGDARLDGLVIEAGYCVSAFDPALGGSTFVDAPIYSADLYCTDDDAAIADVLAGQTGINGQSAADNMDLVNWILNQEFSENGYTDAEVQGAIWSLTDSIDFVRPEYGDLADVQEIVALAEANGEGFEAGPGGIVGLLVDPNPATDANSQPFILAVDFDSMDCLC